MSPKLKKIFSTTTNMLAVTALLTGILTNILAQIPQASLLMMVFYAISFNAFLCAIPFSILYIFFPHAGLKRVMPLLLVALTLTPVTAVGNFLDIFGNRCSLFFNCEHFEDSVDY